MQVFAIFVLAYALSQFFRSFLAVIAPELQREIGLTATDLGNMSAVWFAVFALAQFPVGIALDRVGPRRTVALVMLAGAAGTLLLAMAESNLACLVAMGLIGLGCAPIYMGALYVFGRVYPPERFGLLGSWLLAIGTGGNLIAAAPLATAAAAVGWRTSFVAVAALMLAIALLIAWRVGDPPRVVHPRDGGMLAGLGEVLRIRALWPLLPIVLLSYAVIAAERGLWIGPYFSEVHGLSAVDRGNAAMWMAIAMSAGAFAYGPMEHWLGTRKWVVVPGSLVTAAAFVALWVWPHPSVAAATALLATAGGFGITYGLLMAHGRRFLPTHALGRGITFLNFLFMGGATLVQFVSGRAVDAMRAAGLQPAETYAWLHLGMALALVVSTAIYLTSRDD